MTRFIRNIQRMEEAFFIPCVISFVTIVLMAIMSASVISAVS